MDQIVHRNGAKSAWAITGLREMATGSEIISGLRFGPLGPRTLHLCIDMQLMFAVETKWASEAIWRPLPVVMRIAEHYGPKTIFTKFICPSDLREMPGQWAKFYADAQGMLTNVLDPEMLELLPELRKFVPPARVVARKVFSALASRDLKAMIGQSSTDTLVVTGFETDVCVLATVLSAIDVGLRVILVQDGLASSNDEGANATLEKVFPRFDQQVELVDSEELFRSWRK